MIRIENLCKKYVTKGETVVALNNVNLVLPDSGMVFVLGKSGSGKSTFLNVVGGLDKYDSGNVIINGRSSSNFSDAEFDAYRNTFVGFIFQEYNVLEEFTVGENVMLALELRGEKDDAGRLEKVLEDVELGGLKDRKPATLSGGQKQRIAIARALIKDPEIIMADEPTGALDSETGKQVFETLKRLSANKLVIVVSHDRDFAEKYGDRIIELADGRVINDVIKNAKGGEKADGENLPFGLTVFNGELSVKHGVVLSDEAWEYVRKTIENSAADVFISTNSEKSGNVGGSPEVVKSVAEHKNKKSKAKFAESHAKNDESNTESSGELDSAKQSVVDNKKQLKLKKSRLPFIHALKIGLASLKLKPIRLFFTILLSAFAFMFFGIADAMASFDFPSRAANEAVNQNQLVCEIRKKYVGSDVYDYDDESMRFSDAEINEFNRLTGCVAFKITHELLEFEADYDSAYYYESSPDTIVCDEQSFEKLNFEFVGEGSRFPQKSNEVLMTLYQFELMKKVGTQDGFKVEKYSDVIGHEFDYRDSSDSSFNFVICGIVDTQMDKKLNALKNEAVDYNSQLYREFSYSRDYNFSNSFFITEEFARIRHLLHGATYMSDDDCLFEYGITTDYYFIQGDAASKTRFFDKNKTVLGDDEILVNVNLLNENENNIFDKDFSQMTFDTFYDFVDLTTKNYYDARLYLNEDNRDARKDLKVAGVYFPDDADGEHNYGYYFKLADYEKYMSIIDSYDTVERVRLKLPSDKRQAEKVLSVLESKRYTGADGEQRISITGGVIGSVFMSVRTMSLFKNIFAYIGLFFLFFASLLLFNFISTSVAHKKKEIGILRALGANKIDVFEIFASESFVVSLISSLFACIFAVIALTFVNKYMLDFIGFNVLLFGVRQIVLTFVASALVAFLSSFIPIYRIAKKKPIDAIRN